LSSSNCLILEGISIKWKLDLIRLSGNFPLEKYLQGKETNRKLIKLQKEKRILERHRRKKKRNHSTQKNLEILLISNMKFKRKKKQNL